MTVQGWGRTALDYVPCSYGGSRVLFRGPKREPVGDYVVCLGGTETFGRFIVTPFPELLEGALGLPCINLGVPNAGVDLFLNEPAILDIARCARAVVVQATGAQNVTNGLYSVHPRRNDRFLRAAPALGALFPEVDFTEVHFTRHLLAALAQAGPRRFEEVRRELHRAWTAKMTRLLVEIDAPTLLLAFGRDPLPDRADTGQGGAGLLDRQRLDSLRPQADAVIEVSASRQALAEGTLDMVFHDAEMAAAAVLPGPLAHDEVADAIEPELRRLARL